MTFDDVDAETCMHTLSIDVAAEFREQLAQMYQNLHARNAAINGGLANVVLAGLTLVWLEAVYESWNTPYGESAMSIMRRLKPDTKEVKRGMQRAARDFLRRSRYWVRRTK